MLNDTHSTDQWWIGKTETDSIPSTSVIDLCKYNCHLYTLAPKLKIRDYYNIRQWWNQIHELTSKKWNKFLIQFDKFTVKPSALTKCSV